MADFQFDIPEDNASIIKVVGVGGGGSNAVNNMYSCGIQGVDFIVCNTDNQALNSSPIPNKILLGPQLAEGRGAGAIPDRGKLAADESIEDIKKAIRKEDTKMVFIAAGMGGGTGTGAAPVIAKYCKEEGILVVAIVTIPFKFEGKKRIEQAEEGIRQLKMHVDSIIIVNNEKLRETHGNLKLGEAFKNADDVLLRAAKGIAEIITVAGYINVDFEDVKTVMTRSGVAIMGTGIASGPGRARRAVELALTCPLLNNSNIQGANHILLNICTGIDEITMEEISEITDYIHDESGHDTDVIWGNSTDESLGNSVSLTIIATGFPNKETREIDSPSSTSSSAHIQSNAVPASPNQSTQAAHTFVPSPGPLFTSQQDNTPVNSTQNKEPLNSDNTIRLEQDDSNAESTDYIALAGKLPIENTTNHLPPVKHIEVNMETSPEPTPTQQGPIQPAIEDERKQMLKNMSKNLDQNNNFSELDTPAYKRKGIKFQEIPDPSDIESSNIVVDNNPNSPLGLSKKNSFLHDNVD